MIQISTENQTGSSSSLGESNITVPNLGENFPQRRLIVVLERRDSEGNVAAQLTLNDSSNNVATRVSLSRHCGGIDPKAVIMACNLADETINSLMTLNYAEDNPTVAKVYFGYEKIGESQSGIPLLFEGNVLWAMPVATRPDSWFRIECLETFFKSNTFITTEGGDFSDKEPLDIIEELLSPYYNINTTKFDELSGASSTRYIYYTAPQANYNFSGSIGQFLSNEIYNWGRMSAYIEGGTLHLLPCSDDLDYLSTTVEPEITISAESDPPMIGIPKPNPTGIELTTLFPQDYASYSNYFRVGSYFTLDSKFFPVYNVNYWIQKITYELTNRENASFCNVVARRAI